MFLRRLNLNAALNTRELGGYPCAGGSITAYKSFLRSDSVSNCDDSDIEYLRKYGLTTVIDLRGELELMRAPNVFARCEGIKYFNVSLSVDEVASITDGSVPEELPENWLQEFYIRIIKEHGRIKKLFKTIVENMDGVTLFHCTAGKDRTGVTVCLLLMLAGVARADILADYQVTYTYMRPMVLKFLEKYPDMPQNTGHSNPDWMEAAYEYVIDNYGGAENYLKTVGLSETEIGSLKEKLIYKG